jgi:hypothetical protein
MILADYFVWGKIIRERVIVGEYSTGEVLTIPHLGRKQPDFLSNDLILQY